MMRSRSAAALATSRNTSITSEGGSTESKFTELMAMPSCSSSRRSWVRRRNSSAINARHGQCFIHTRASQNLGQLRFGDLRHQELPGLGVIQKTRQVHDRVLDHD